jgi:hypothetical protein
MSDLPKRKIRLFDTMILVAVFAITISWLRFMASFGDYPPYPFQKRGIALAYIAASWLVFFTMLSLVPIRLIQPRPAIARLWRQPGWLACNINAFVVLYVIANHLPSLMTGLRSSLPLQRGEIVSGCFLSLTTGIDSGAGMAIATGWATLALVGRWEPGEDWIDRAGTICGIWLIVCPVRSFCVWYLGLT